jgi:hypothetical protein
MILQLQSSSLMPRCARARQPAAASPVRHRSTEPSTLRRWEPGVILKDVSIEPRPPNRWTGDKTMLQRTFDLIWDLGKALVFAAVFWLLAKATGIVKGHNDVTWVALATLGFVVVSASYLIYLEFPGDDEEAAAHTSPEQRMKSKLGGRFAGWLAVLIFGVPSFLLVLILERYVGGWAVAILAGAFALVLVVASAVRAIARRKGSPKHSPTSEPRTPPD